LKGNHSSKIDIDIFNSRGLDLDFLLMFLIYFVLIYLNFAVKPLPSGRGYKVFFHVGVFWLSIYFLTISMGVPPKTF